MKRSTLLIISSLYLFLLFSLKVKAQEVTILQQDKPVSIRGLSVVDDKTAWISSSKGNVAVTHDGGKTWDWQQITGYEKSDFRDIEAFSDKEAVIMASGTPAVVLKTIDGGKSWQEKYRKTDTTYFLDAMDFDGPKRGWILGDAINKKLLLLETKDGGETWATLAELPDALPGEGSFAASGTCLRADGQITIVTGGINTRILTSPEDKYQWTAVPLQLTHGQPSQGAFSVARGRHEMLVVGGDYQKDTVADSATVIFPRSVITGKQVAPVHGPAGFQSCVEYLGAATYLATGTSGTNLTTDGGATWKKIDATSFNVCRKAKHGNLILLAGNKGKIALFKL